MSDLRREPQQHNLPSIFFENEDGNFCLCCCHCMRLFFVVAWDGVSWLSALLVQRVSRTWRVAEVSRGCMFLLFFTSSSLRVLLLFLMFLPQEIWGMNMPNLPEVSYLEDLLVIGCVCCTCVAAIDAPLTMIIIAEWVLLWYSWCPHDAFVVFIGKAALWLQGWSPQLSSLH